MVDDRDSGARRQSLGRVVGSVFASMFGVQSSAKHQEDFAKGRPMTYIAIGLVATLVFVLLVLGLVKWVISVATGS